LNHDDIADEFTQDLLQGIEPFPLTQALQIAGVYKAALVGAGIEVDIEAMVSYFDSSTEARLLMMCARRAGISFSAASERWADLDDLVAEIAWDVIEAANAVDRCQRCGVRPDQVIDTDDPRHRMLDEPDVKLRRRGCEVCRTLAKLRGELSEKAKEQGVDWYIEPRRPGEPFIDGKR
jgi:hypothetical protein